MKHDPPEGRCGKKIYNDDLLLKDLPEFIPYAPPQRLH